MSNPTIINRTDIPNETINFIVHDVCINKELPQFYLICQTPEHNGVTITGLDKPCIIIDVHNHNQFVHTLKHELIHLKQHENGYASEEEVEIIMTDKHKTKNDKKSSWV